MTNKAPKNIVALVSGFTPCPDALVDMYSHTTALVWGKIWRYSQMAEGICRASIQRLADELGLAPNTVVKHITLLEDGKYIVDKTPDVRNRPHIYKDTGKLRLKVAIFMDENITGTQKLSSRYSKIAVEESTTDRVEEKNIFKAYESNIGPLTPMVADELKASEKVYPSDWIFETIGLAVVNNKRNWRYCEEILKRWKANGKDDGKGKPSPKQADSVKRFPKFVDGKAVFDE